MNAKYMVIAVAAVVVIGGAAAYMVISGDGEEKGGWYAWDPETFLVSSSNLAPSPYWTKVIEDMYKELYGDVPSYDKYTVDDLPEGYLTYDSLVSRDNSGNTVIESKYRLSTSQDWQSYYITIDPNNLPTGVISSGSYMMSLYYVMCIDAGVDPMAYDEDIVAEMWSKAHAGDQSLFKNLSLNYNMPEGFSGTELPNPSFLQDNMEVTLKCIEDLTNEGKVPVWISGGGMPAYDKGGEWMIDTMEAYGGYTLMFGSISTFSDCLASIEAIAYMFGYGDSAQEVIDTLRLQMYTLQEASKDAVAESGHRYTGLGTYTNSDWTFNSASGAGEMFKVLNIENIYTLETSGNWDGENVVKAEPEVILFTLSDPSQVDWDQAMRVPQEAAA